ncbi:MAG: hypothetical protein IT162_07115 [Bryobacterales bacterium]|nr:hypothetical protein [Bryobacterales bacterium]
MQLDDPGTAIDELASIDDALKRLESGPVVLVANANQPDRLQGILTAFDLL